jgi:hypothetical protein
MTSISKVPVGLFRAIEGSGDKSITLCVHFGNTFTSLRSVQGSAGFAALIPHAVFIIVSGPKVLNLWARFRFGNPLASLGAVPAARFARRRPSHPSRNFCFFIVPC